MTNSELRTLMLFKYIRDNNYIHYFVKDLKKVEKENNVCAYMVIPIYKETQNQDKPKPVKKVTKNKKKGKKR